MRKNYFVGIAALFLGVVMITISGCYKETFDFNDMKEDFITWEPDLAIPLVNSTLSSQDIIAVADSTNIYDIDDNNFITLIYRSRIFSQTINEFLQVPILPPLPTIINLDTAELSGFTNSQIVDKTVSQNLVFSISSPGSAQLEEVEFRSGFMRIAFTSDFEHIGQLQVSMPQLTLNGNPFDETYDINYLSGQVSEVIDVPLAGYRMNLINSGQNNVPIDYTVSLTYNSSGAAPSTANAVSIAHSLEDIVLQSAEGDFGNFSIDVDPGTVDLDLVQNLTNGSVYFEDPKLTLVVSNGIGAPVSLSVPQLDAVGNGGLEPIDIASHPQFNGDPPSTNIAAATSVTTPSISEYTLNNVASIVNDLYTELVYDIDAQLNPDGPGNNFAEFNNAIEVRADVELPFYGNVNNYTIVDTIEVPLSEAEQFADNIENALLRISTVSQFPTDGLLKLYFADESYNLLDSVLTDGSFVIRSAVMTSAGDPTDPTALRASSPTITNNDIVLNSTKISNLFNSKYLLLSSALTTSNNAAVNVKLFADDYIKVEIGLRAQLKASPSDIDDL